MTLNLFIKNIILNGLEFFGKYYSTYYGFVVSKDDPENRNRLLVIVQEVFGPTAPAQWAIPMYSYSGKGYGMQLLPEVGDMVNISFRHGNPEYPMWAHSSYGDGDKPNEFKELDVKGLITPSGIKILLDSSEAYITVSSPNGDTISISEDTIVIKHSSGVHLEFKDGELQVGKGSLQHLVKGEDLQKTLNSLITQLKTWSQLIQVDPGSHKNLIFFNPSGLSEKINNLLTKYS